MKAPTALVAAIVLAAASLAADGYYRLERLANDAWRILDPQGETFVPLGVEHCRLWGEARSPTG